MLDEFAREKAESKKKTTDDVAEHLPDDGGAVRKDLDYPNLHFGTQDIADAPPPGEPAPTPLPTEGRPLTQPGR